MSGRCATAWGALALLVSAVAPLAAQDAPPVRMLRPGAIMPSPGDGPNGAAQPLRPGAIPQPGQQPAPVASAPVAAPPQPAAQPAAAPAPVGRRFDQQRALGSRPPVVNDRRPPTGRPPVGFEQPAAAAAPAAPAGPVRAPAAGPRPAASGSSAVAAKPPACPPGRTIRIVGGRPVCG